MQPIRTRRHVLIRAAHTHLWLPAIVVLAAVALACGGGDDKETSQNGSAAPTSTTTTAPTSPPTAAPPPAASSSSTEPAATLPIATQPPTSTPATTPTATPAKMAKVTISNFAFQPPSLTVAPGTKVTWTNQDDAAHSIADTSPMHTPESKHLAKSETFSITYAKSGTYAYICGIHNYMMGSVTVK